MSKSEVVGTAQGASGRAFLEWAVSNASTLRERVRAGVDRLAGQWILELASGQVDRVARRFAVVATAGELATEAGITGWPAGEATRAARVLPRGFSVRPRAPRFLASCAVPMGLIGTIAPRRL